MKKVPLHSLEAKGSFNAESSEWAFRPVRQHDLVRVAGWITTLMQSRAGREEEIASWLDKEWIAGRASGYASYYMVTLYGQPLLHITAIPSKKKEIAESPGEITLYLLISPAFADNEDVCLKAVGVTCDFFYLEEDVQCLKVSIAAADKVLKKALRCLGFYSVSPEGRYTSTLQSWIPA